MMADVILNPSFPQDEFDKIVKQSLSGLESSKNDPNSISSNMRSRIVYGANHPYGDVMTKIPLFKNHIRFEKIDEFGWSIFDMEIHEHPIIENFRIGVFKSRIEHLEKTNIEKYLSKHNHYSNWESRRLAQDESIADLRLRIKLKYILLKSPFTGLMYFIYAFVLKLGFLDGGPGFVIAFGNFEGTFYRYIKLTESQSDWKEPSVKPIKRIQ